MNLFDVQASTKIKLGATAGLRLLPEGKADLILDAVKSYFEQSPFILDPDTGVTILDGKYLNCIHDTANFRGYRVP